MQLSHRGDLVSCCFGMALALSLAVHAGALSELWSCETGATARSLPIAVDCNADGRPEVLATTRFDGTLWVLDADGTLAGRVVRPQWLEGCVAAATRRGAQTPTVVFQESTGRVNLTDGRGDVTRSIEVEGDPCIGVSPCLADLDGDGSPEIVVTRRNGIVTVLDRNLQPQWQYDADAPFDSSPAAAPVFEGMSAVYVQSINGVLHCVAGDGRPLWQFRMKDPGPRFPSLSDPLVVRLEEDHPTVLVSDKVGRLYAVDAVTGTQQWTIAPGTAPLGTPAIIEADTSGERRLITVSERGELAFISDRGVVLRTGKLPEGGYVPRPLVADVDEDGWLEVIVASREYSLVVANLNGQVKERLTLFGSALEGLTLADLNNDGSLELLAATDCARIQCFATRAKGGWVHPRADAACSGWVPPIQSRAAVPAVPAPRSAIRQFGVVVPDYVRDTPFAAAVVARKHWEKGKVATLVIRRDGKIVGSTVKPVGRGGIVVPFVHSAEGNLSVDITLWDDDGKPIAVTEGFPARPAEIQAKELAPPAEFLGALVERGRAYRVPEAWKLPVIGDRDSWHVVRYMPEKWSAFGLADKPFIRDAAPRIWSPAVGSEAPFGPDHVAWPVIQADTKPFFVMNDYFRPKARYPDALHSAIVGMASDRFLGYPVHEWAYGIWKSRLEGQPKPPGTRQEATSVVESEFKQLLEMCHGRMYEGEGYCLFHHHAFEWGAPMGYAEVGENIPCAPLQFAFLRGAARQYGGRPWGAYLSNWFRGTVYDSRFRAEGPRTRWAPSYYADGPDCGHSPSLEFRLEMAAHLAGATFVHHESDAHHDSIFVEEKAKGEYVLSPFGAAMQRWYAYSKRWPERGIPFTPIAFLVDFHHGWRPREDIYGLWPRQRPDLSMEAVFAHVFPYGGRLDFERGYLANGPYGDIFDVLTNHADVEVLSGYGVVWPLADVDLTKLQAQALTDYVHRGGILVVDGALAEQLPKNLVGVRLRKETAWATHIQTPLQGMPLLVAPYRFRPMRLTRRTQPLAWTGSGEPILAWNRVGKGMIIAGATDHWVDDRNRLLPIVGAVLRCLADAFLPVRAAADVEMLISRTEKGWVIGLINNNGVTKVPTQPCMIDPAEARDCLLFFLGRGPLRFVSRMGEFRWHNQAGGLYTRIPPGEVAVVEVHFSGNGP